MTYKINIEKPCSENWNEMTANEQGRFCLKCNKTVQDFSTLTDKELIQILKDSKGEICAKTSINQLNRDIISRDKSINVFRKYYKIVAGVFLINIPQFVVAQTNKEKVEVSPIDTKNTDSTQNTVFDKPRFIKGTISDSVNNEPIIGALIKFNSKNYSTDIEGKFKLKLDKLDLDTAFITISYPGYKMQTVFLKSMNLNNVVIRLEEMFDETFMIGALVNTKPKKWWQFWK
ncbi:MAG: hypothetical protein RLZZ175_2823 [Bacteroidota bacterium]|jgi:hypothetical protein